MIIGDAPIKSGLNNPQIKSLACKSCQNTFAFHESEITSKLTQRRPGPIASVAEIGIVCPGCGHFYHVAYTNKVMDLAGRAADLERHPIRRSRERAKFSRRFQRFQEEMAAYRLAAPAQAENEPIPAE